MKKILFSLLLLVTVSAFAQNKEKIKGSREVIKDYKVLESFNSLKIGNELEVRLLRSDEAAIEITADDNLIEVISVNNIDGELSLKSTHRISSFKSLKITVFYTDDLTTIEVNKKAEIHSDVTLKFKELTLINNDESKSFLTINTDKFKFTNNKESRAKLNVTANNITLELNDNSTIEALLEGDAIEIDMVQRAEAKIEGDAKSLDLNIDNSCEFDGKKLSCINAKLFTSNRVKVSIEAKETLELSASGTSEVSIYGKPQINLTKFDDEAIIYKKK